MTCDVKSLVGRGRTVWRRLLSPQYFSTLENSLVSLFVLVTTAKWAPRFRVPLGVQAFLSSSPHGCRPVRLGRYFPSRDSCLSRFPLSCSFPDVMMPAYSKNRWSCVFFIVYLSIELYFIMNLVRIGLGFGLFSPLLRFTPIELDVASSEPLLCDRSSASRLCPPPAPGGGVRHV